MAGPNNPLGTTGEQLNRATSILTSGLNQLKELFASIGNQLGSLVKLYNPAAYNQFKIAVEDAEAALGRIFLPTLRQFTVIVRGLGDGLASLGPQAQTLVRALAAAAISMGVAAAAAFALNAAVNAATGGIPALLGLVAGGFVGMGLALKNVKEVQDSVRAVMRPLVALFNELGKVAVSVFEAIKPALHGLTGALTGALGGLGQLVASLAPRLTQFAAQFAAMIQPFIQHFAAMVPILLQIAQPILQLGQALQGLQMQVIGVLMGAITPLLPVVRALAQAFGTVVRAIVAALTPVLSVIGAVVQTAVQPVLTMVQRLAPVLEAVIQVVNAALQPLVAAFEEFGSIAGELAAAVGGVLAEAFQLIASLLPDITPLIQVAVRVFASAMHQVVETIRFVADVIRTLLGLPDRQRGPQAADSTFRPGAGDGLSVRSTQISGITEFLNQARKSAFAIGGQAETPQQKNTSAVSELTTSVKSFKQTLDDLMPHIKQIANRIGQVKDAAGAVGSATSTAASYGVFGAAGLAADALFHKAQSLGG